MFLVLIELYYMFDDCLILQVQRALSKMPHVRSYRRHAIPRYLNFGHAPLGLVFLVLADEGELKEFRT
jgi:hypothetical protein